MLVSLFLAYRYGLFCCSSVMHIVALAWIYVVFMMAITENSVVAGIMTFLMYGVLPLSIILYLSGTRERNRRRTEREKVRHGGDSGLENEGSVMER